MSWHPVHKPTIVNMVSHFGNHMKSQKSQHLSLDQTLFTAQGRYKGRLLQRQDIIHEISQTASQQFFSEEQLNRNHEGVDSNDCSIHSGGVAKANADSHGLLGV